MDLSTRYLGFDLPHPFMPGASPFADDMDAIRVLEDSGAAAIVLNSLFEEQIEHDTYQVHEALEFGAESYAEHAGGFLPEYEAYNTGPESYIDLVARAREELSVPVIASLNGITTGGWVEYARRLEVAGAHALELNVYFIAADIDDTSQDVEQRYLDLVSAVRETIDIPLAVKIGPYFSAMANMARRVTEAGANGLVLFNRFYQPDIHLEDLEVVPNVVLSTSNELRLPLRWIAILKGRVEASLAATTGVHTGEDVLKLLLAGADVTMMASALLRHGPEWIRTVEEGVREWLETHDYVSVEQMKGSMSQASAPDPAAFERSNYMESLISYSAPIV